MSIASLYPSINPSLLLDFANVKRLDPRITFTRTTTATYYDGVTTAKAEQNLLTYSQDFSNAVWTQDQTSLTGSQTAPDGSSTAWLLTDNAASADHRIYSFNDGSTATYTVYSAYLKNGTRQYAMLRVGGGGGYAGAVFDLSTGTVSSTGGTAYYSSSITSVGNGWYRCVVIGLNISGAISLVIALSNTATYSNNIGYSGSGQTIYGWGAQLEYRNTASATAYTATTTQAITNYIPVLLTAGGGQPRFDHNPTTSESLGLLIEEQRTNLMVRSEEFDSGTWSKPNGVVVTPNIGVAPNGTLSADLITASANNAFVGCYQSGVGSTSISVYAKAAGKSWFMFINTIGNAGSAWFNLTAGTIGTVLSGYTAAMTSVGNGWYRISVTAGTGSFAYWQFAITDSDNSTSVTANSVNGIFVWGAQGEVGSFPTSYIATTGSTATRNADAASMTGTNFSSWFNNGEGTLYGEMQRAQGAISGTNFHIATIGNSSSSGNYYKLRFEGSSTVRAGLSYTSGTEQCGFTQGTTTAGNFYKLCLGIKVNDFGFSSDNTTASTDTSGTVPIGLNQMIIGADVDGTSQIANNRIRKLAYYPIRVTNAQLQALTV